MTTLFILIILIFGLPYLWRAIRPYIYRWMQRRTEDYIRNAMGMPPRGKQKTNSRHSGDSSETRSKSRTKSYRKYGEPVIPKEYAEDVEFTEIKTYSEQQIIAGEEGISYSNESQVSDAEIIEIHK
ncbi:MAG: hypothetical protein NC095_02140 [Muribaculum sp.]|nr:hypothetical protein [Muribaculum sp.]